MGRRVFADAQVLARHHDHPAEVATTSPRVPFSHPQVRWVPVIP